MLLDQPQNIHTPLNQPPISSTFNFDGPPSDVDAAAALVIQNTERAEKFLQTRLWMTEWRISKALYEAPVKQEFWRDTLVPRSSNSYPLIAQHVRAIEDQVMPALFPDDPPFELVPTEGTPWQVARGWKEILGFQVKETGLKAEMRKIVKDAEIFGTGIAKYGWERVPKKAYTYVRTVPPKRIKSPIPGQPDTIIHTKESDQLNEVETTTWISQPYFRRVEVNHVLVDPSLRSPDIRKARYVVYRDYMTIRDLNKLRDLEGWMIPDEATLRALAEPPTEQPSSTPLENEATAYPAQGHRPLPRYIDSSYDPLDHKLEVLEQWTEESVIVVLQRKLTIRNEVNTLGCIPFLSCYWDDIPGCFYSFGIPRRIGSIQTHITGLRNTRLDDIQLNLMHMWKVKRGSNVGAQPIRQYPGAMFKVNDMADIEPLERQPVLNEAWQEESVLMADAEKTTGANEQTIQGAMPSQPRSSLGRTATGAGILGGASTARIQGFVDIIADQVMIPAITSFLKMDRRLLDPSMMRKLVGPVLWKSMDGRYPGDYTTDLLDKGADIEFKMLAASSIAGKQRMAQYLPAQSQLFASPAFLQGLTQQGMKVNWLEIGRRWETLSGYNSQEDIFIPMTPQDQQASQQNNKAMINAQATQQRLTQIHQQNLQMEQVKHQNRLEEIDAKGVTQSGQNVFEKAVDRDLEREELPLLSPEG